MLTAPFNRIFILVLTILVSAVYFNSLNHNFVLDDEGLILKNPLIKSDKLFPLIFKTGLYDYSDKARTGIAYDKMYRPLQLLTYVWDYKIWGQNPTGFHLTNIFIHLINCILVYYLFSLFFDSACARIISILFAVHPIQVSVVGYIGARADLLVCFFMLLSMILFFRFIKAQGKGYYLLSLTAASLALLCRENALILFMFIALILFAVKAKPRIFLSVLSFFALGIIYLAARSILLGPGALRLHPAFISLPLRIVNFLQIVPRYISLLILPLNLHMFRTTPFITSLFEIRVIFILLFVLSSIWFLIRLRSNKLLSFSISWFLIGLIPVFFFLDGYPGLDQAMMAESWVYLSSAGFFGLFAILGYKNLGRILITLLIIIYALFTLINNLSWNNNIIIYRNILKYTSERNPIRKHLAREYLRAGLYQDAWRQIKKFAFYYPEYSERYVLEGDYYYARNQIPEAIESYNTSLILNKYNFLTFYNLSLCFAKLKQPDKAMEYALESTRLNPYYLDGLALLGDLYKEKGQYSESIKYYRRSQEIDPGNKRIREKLNDEK